MASAQRAGSWAYDKLAEAERLGATMFRTASACGTTQATLGDASAPGETLFTLPNAVLAPVDEAYCAVTGELLSPFHFLKLVRFCAGDDARYAMVTSDANPGAGVVRDASELDDQTTMRHYGWTVQMISFPQND